MASISALNSASNVCNYCAKSGASKKCGQCRLALYCGQDCQKNAWPEHKKVCKRDDPKVSSAARSASVIPPNDIVSEMEEYFRVTNDSWQKNQEKFGADLRMKHWPNAAKKIDQNKTVLGVKPFPGGIAFDLGAGNGKETKALLENGYKVVAIDSYRGFGEDMNPLQSEYAEALTVREEEIGENSLPQNGTVDLILALHSLFYCSPAIQIPLLRKVYSSLKPGGMFSASYLDKSKIPEKDLKYILMAAWFFPNAEKAKKLLEALGFRVLVMSEGMSLDVICFKQGN